MLIIWDYDRLKEVNWTNFQVRQIGKALYKLPICSIGHRTLWALPFRSDPVIITISLGLLWLLPPNTFISGLTKLLTCLQLLSCNWSCLLWCWWVSALTVYPHFSNFVSTDKKNSPFICLWLTLSVSCLVMRSGGFIYLLSFLLKEKKSPPCCCMNEVNEAEVMGCKS